MKWEKIASRARSHAHQLRQALAGALELHGAGKWGRAEVEAAGVRDYTRIFGHAISERNFWRVFDRVISRADADATATGGKVDFSRLEIYLPGTVAAEPAAVDFVAASGTLPSLAQAVRSVKSLATPTAEEVQLVWDAACGEWRALTEAGAKPAKARKTVLRALAASGVDLARTPRALRVTFARKMERWIEGGYTPEALRDLRAEQSGHFRAVPISDDDRRMLIARGLAGGVAKAWRDARTADQLSAEIAQGFIGNPSRKSYVPTRVREIVAPAVAMLQDLHHGPRQAKLNGAYITRDWSAVLPGDWYQADDTTLPLYYWEEDAAGVPRVMRGQCLVMVDCKTGRVLTFALHSERNYNATVIRGLILRTHNTYGLPREGFHFERGIWASAKILKGKAGLAPNDMASPEETELGLREWVKFTHAQPGNARSKIVERIIGLLQTRMENQPGYCGRNEQVEKFERLQKELLHVQSGRLHPRDFMLHRDEWAARLAEICDAYNNEGQEGRTQGLSPREAWDTGFDFKRPLVRLPDPLRYLLANHRRPLKVTRNGICVHVGKTRTWFRNEVTGRLVGQVVQVYFNPEDLSSVFVRLTSDDKSAEVIPAAPAIPAMTATREQLRDAQASVAAHNAGAQTLYQEIKPYFPQNGPSHFRLTIGTQETVEQAREIAAEQEAIREAKAGESRTRREIAKHRARSGVIADDSVSAERQLAGYKLLEEASHDAD